MHGSIGRHNLLSLLTRILHLQITYTYPPWALWQKPLTVAAVCSSLFAFAVLFKRLEFGFSSVTGYREEKKLKVD